MYPIVVETTPENGSTGHKVADPITLTFGASVVPSTVTNKTVKMQNNNTLSHVPVTLTLDEDNNILTITPKDVSAEAENLLCYQSEYQITISGVKSIGGVDISGVFKLTLTTERFAAGATPAPPVNTNIFALQWVYPKPNTCFEYIAKASTFITKGSLYGNESLTRHASGPQFANLAVTKGIPNLLVLSFTKDVRNDNAIVTVEKIAYDYEGGSNTYRTSVFGENEYDSVLGGVTTAVIEQGINTTCIYRQILGLEYDSKYKVTVTNIKAVSGEDLEDIVYYFYIAPNPSYISISDLFDVGMKEIREHLNECNIDSILNIISQATQVCYSIATSGTGTNIASPPAYVGEYIKEKVRNIILSSMYFEISLSPSQEILGDMTVAYYSNGLLNFLKESGKKLDRLENLLYSGYTKVRARSAGKGTDVDDVPGFLTRQLKDLDGNKSW